METRPEAGGTPTVVRRRRRTRKHRRNRLIRRIVLLFFVLALGAGISFVALHYVSPSLFRGAKSVAPDRQAVEASREKFVAAQQEALRAGDGRHVYPYSVVPGGVQDVRELKWAAEHDPVVAAHYAGFDYDHARVVRLVLARTAYVSYRIGNRVYWTRHRISLKAGETLITDGKITARTRCANRVEEVPPQLHSSVEPRPEEFDEPFPQIPGTAVTNPPVPYQSALLLPSLPPIGPAPPLSLYDPFGPGNYIPIEPPPLPSGVCGPTKKKTGEGGGKKKNGNPCGSGGGGSGAVPEPGTWLLTASGLALLTWMARKRVRAGSSSQDVKVA